MDLKRVLKGAANFTSEIGKATIPVAKEITKASVAISKAGKEKAEETVERVKENRELEKDTSRIVKEAERSWQDSISRLEATMEDFKETLQTLEKQREHIISVHGVRFMRLCEYEKIFSDDALGESIFFESQLREFQDSHECFVQDELHSNPALRGIATGVASAATAATATALLGTASAGTAIAGLHGAAAMNATLASLGGGSLASGGFGIAGGLTVLGGLVVIPGLAVGGFIWDKNVRNEHASAVKYASKAEEARNRAITTREKYRKYFKVLRELEYETIMFNGVLDGLLDLFEFDLIDGTNDKSKKLCSEAWEIAKKLLSLEVVAEQGKPNEIFSEEIKGVHNEVDQLKYRIGSYLAALNEERKEEAQKQIEEVMKKFKENREKKPIIKALRNEELRDVFIKMFDWAKKEICILSPWINEAVVDPIFVDKMERALARGVSIRIVYGIGDFNSNQKKKKNDDARNIRTEKVATELKNRFSHYGKKFAMHRSNTHGKLLICDDLFYVMTSFNFLSFTGDYKGQDVREEIGDYSEDKGMIALYKDRHFAF